MTHSADKITDAQRNNEQLLREQAAAREIITKEWIITIASPFIYQLQINKYEWDN